MHIFINGNLVETKAKTLAEIVSTYSPTCHAAATAVDGTFIARDQRDAFSIRPDMHVEILVPMQGG